MRFHALFLLTAIGLLHTLTPEVARAEKDPDGIMARRVGVWNAKVTIKVPVQMTFEGQEKIGWVLGHNYLLGKGFYDDKGDGKKTEVINLMTYSEKDKRYYIWEFKADVGVQPVPTTGTWDAKTEEMMLSADYGDQGTGEGIWKFEKDGSFTWTYEMKNKKGKVVFSMEGTQTKVKTDEGTTKKSKANTAN